MADRIFISYERSDRAIARRLAEALEQAGLSVWWDRKLLAGDAFDKTIQEALNAARCVVVLWSKTSVLSDWVKDEATEGLKRGILVPVLIDDADIPLGFRRLHTVHVDWKTSSPTSELSEVIAAVKHVLSRPDEEEALPTAVAGVNLEEQRPTLGHQGNVDGGRELHPKIRKWMAEDYGFLKLAAIAVAIVVALLTLYRTARFAQPASVGSPADSTPATGTTSPVTTGSQLTSSTSDNGTTSSVIEFNWPGGDCWDIFRGDQLMTYQCGAGTQALQAGNYTIKAKHAPVFFPFEVAIKTGATTRIESGGLFEFNWPGGDCWDIFRGDQLVTYQCGAGTQALLAGNYAIKAKHAPVFFPFEVAIKTGATTRIERGGLFEFNWPGGDCWDIFRGDQLVTYQCGAGKQALQAGKYTIKGKHAPVFAPFEIAVADGGQVKAP